MHITAKGCSEEVGSGPGVRSCSSLLPHCTAWLVNSRPHFQLLQWVCSIDLPMPLHCVKVESLSVWP